MNKIARKSANFEITTSMSMAAAPKLEDVSDMLIFRSSPLKLSAILPAGV